MKSDGGRGAVAANAEAARRGRAKAREGEGSGMRTDGAETDAGGGGANADADPRGPPRRRAHATAGVKRILIVSRTGRGEGAKEKGFHLGQNSFRRRFSRAGESVNLTEGRGLLFPLAPSTRRAR